MNGLIDFSGVGNIFTYVAKLFLRTAPGSSVGKHLHGARRSSFSPYDATIAQCRNARSDDRSLFQSFTREQRASRGVSRRDAFGNASGAVVSAGGR